MFRRGSQWGGVLLVLALGCVADPPSEPPDGGVGEPDAGEVVDAGGPRPDPGVFYETPMPCPGAPTCTEYEDMTGEAYPSNTCGGQICACSSHRCIRLRVGQRFLLHRSPSGTNPAGSTYGYAFNSPGCFAPACAMEVDVVP